VTPEERAAQLCANSPHDAACAHRDDIALAIRAAEAAVARECLQLVRSESAYAETNILVGLDVDRISAAIEHRFGVGEESK